MPFQAAGFDQETALKLVSRARAQRLLDGLKKIWKYPGLKELNTFEIRYLKMQEFTKSLIASLDRISWCKNVGVPVVQNAVQVTSWDEAAVYASSDENKQFGSDMANQIGVQALKLKLAGKYEYDWNEVPRAVRSKINELVVQVFSECGIQSHPSQNVLAATMKWNLMGWVIEAEHSHMIAPGYFTMLGEFYKEGHFPCGWQGKSWPEGLLIVY